MGQPNDISPAQVKENYNWGEFGSADQNGVNLSNTARDTVRSTQSGINQYVKELMNPSYNNESFRARQEALDASNNLYAKQLGANAIARGARGSATQSILNNVMANRNNDMRNAMLSEDTRIANILSALSGIEGNYWQQSNSMADNILKRVVGNQTFQNSANVANTEAYNAWRNNIISGIATIAGGIMGGPAGAALAGSLANGMTTQYGDAVDPGQVASANNMVQY